MNGKELRTLRRQYGYSMYQLGKKIGVHESTVGLWERGKRQPKEKYLKKIAKLYNLPYPFKVEKPKKLTRSEQNYRQLERRILLERLAQKYGLLGNFDKVPEDDEDWIAYKKLVGGK